MTILEKLIILHKMTKKDLAAQLGITTKSLENKLKYIEKWNDQEIKSIKELFKLMPWQLELMFFVKVLSDTQMKMRKAWIKSMDYLINYANSFD